MRILKLLNKKYLSIILIFLLYGFSVNSENPVDIWSLEEKKSLEENTIVENLEEKSISQNSIYEMQSQKIDQLSVDEDQTLISKEIEIIGLYDPAKNGLNINMWINSDGDQILNLFKNINKTQLSKDASEILDILLLTNSYYPSKNISKKQFLEIKSKWLIKNSNLKLIEDYLLNNQIINENIKLTKYLVDEYLSRSEIEKCVKFFLRLMALLKMIIYQNLIYIV